MDGLFGVLPLRMTDCSIQVQSLVSPWKTSIPKTEHLIVMASRSKLTPWLRVVCARWHVPKENFKNNANRSELSCLVKKMTSFRQSKYMCPCLQDKETEPRGMIRTGQSRVHNKQKIQHQNLYYLTLELAFFLLLPYISMESLGCK